MSKRTRPGLARRRALWLRVVAELGAAPITEAYIAADDLTVDGVCEDGRVVINPSHQTVDTVIHELLHRLYPERSERSIKRTTTELRAVLTDDEVETFYGEYKRRRKKGRRRAV